MNIWGVPTPAEEPFLTLRSWRVLQCSDGERYLNGWCEERAEGRCSTAVVAFDRERSIATTVSGRRYKLTGEPGLHPDAVYTWIGYSRLNEIEIEADVSDEYRTRT
jgi:hypothetical protein